MVTLPEDHLTARRLHGREEKATGVRINSADNATKIMLQYCHGYELNFLSYQFFEEILRDIWLGQK